MRIYIAGPYTQGDVAVNVRNAVLAANEVLDAGHTPFVPHLTHLWHLITPRPYEDWLCLDIKWLKICDVVIRLPGESAGADEEVAVAERLNIPVFGSVAEFLDFVKERAA